MAAGLRVDDWQAVCPVTGNLGTLVWARPEFQAPAALTALPAG
jgi:hypothetical protein